MQLTTKKIRKILFQWRMVSLIYLPFVANAINLTVSNCNFLKELNNSDIISFYEQEDHLKEIK